jgi:glycosyltransferase involved in cell wall biosynthesis
MPDDSQRALKPPSGFPPREWEVSPDFLVVIPTFRREEYLRQALCSVLTQQDVIVTVIIVDDSPEHSAEGIVRELDDPRVTYLKNPLPTGGNPSTVRNLGMSYVRANQIRGNFVHFLDDDDIVPEGLYRAAKKAFLAHPNIGVVFGRVEPFGDPSKETQLAQERRFFADAAHRALACYRIAGKWPIKAHRQTLTQFLLTTQMMFGRSLLVCSSALVRRDCLDEVSGFDQDILLCEDSEFYARAIRRCGALFLDRPSLRFRISGTSLMHTTDVSSSARAAEEWKVGDGIRRKQAKLQEELGPRFYAWKAFARIIRPILERIPIMFEHSPRGKRNSSIRGG